MSLLTRTRPVLDRDVLASEHFADEQYRVAALKVANRIREDLGLPPADRLVAGYPEDSRWGNPVSLTVTAGVSLMAARFEEAEGRIFVDLVDQVREYPLTRGSVVSEFIRRFDAGSYPELNARKDI